MDVSFTADESWRAPFYELYVEIGPHPESLPKLTRALDALWRHPTLDGPYADQSKSPSAQPRVDVAEYVSNEVAHMLGVATLPDGRCVPCGCVPHIPDLAVTLGLAEEVQKRLDYGSDPLEPGPDSFTFYVPSGALHQLYGELETGEFGELPQQAIDEWLIGVARSVFEDVPFPLAAVGPEGSYNPERLSHGGGDLVLQRTATGELALITRSS